MLTTAIIFTVLVAVWGRSGRRRRPRRHAAAVTVTVIASGPSRPGSSQPFTSALDR
jgi:hypothetical protein